MVYKLSGYLPGYSCSLLLFHSYRVLTRKADHWSQRISTDNPRGYNDTQLQRIAAAPTAAKKRRAELNVMNPRRHAEKVLKTPIVDEYGMARIVAMIADINAQYPPPQRPRRSLPTR
jgi:hypothetical protein